MCGCPLAVELGFSVVDVSGYFLCCVWCLIIICLCVTFLFNLSTDIHCVSLIWGRGYFVISAEHTLPSLRMSSVFPIIMSVSSLTLERSCISQFLTPVNRSLVSKGYFLWKSKTVVILCHFHC